MTRLLCERPDYRNKGKYQFVKGYTGGGAEMCVHLTKEEISERCCEQVGPGTLIDDGVDLWWEQQVPKDGTGRKCRKMAQYGSDNGSYPKVLGGTRDCI